jgi:cytochrome P450 family 142 subfamily A polypeptide 1
MLLFESANFDEQQFDGPETFSIYRHPNKHVAFGFGTHFCLGNQLARMELAALTQRVVKRLPDLALTRPDAMTLRPANFISGLETMPVTFTPTAPLAS